MRYPDFILIGAPKCGTTALFEFLGQHPEVRLSPAKEPHYFSYLGDGLPLWATKTEEDYGKLFDPYDSRVQGEASTWYLYSPTAAATIRERVPEAKIIAMLRNPVERAFSSYLFRLQNGWETYANFKAAVRAEPQRISEGAEWDFHYVAAGLYHRQLARYYDLFPSDQIKVLLHEDFRQSPEECLRSVCGFLGIDAGFAFDTKLAINVTKPPRFPLLNRFLARNPGFIERMRGIVPSCIYGPVSQLKHLNQKSRPSMDVGLRRELAEYYRDDIKRLELLLQKDLSIWTS